MKRLILLGLLVFSSSSAFADMRGLPNITVLAASSLTAPMTEIVREYSREHDITVTASYNSSSEQAWQIEDGNSADIFISSHPQWMSSLKQMGLIDVYSLTNLVKNKLALVTAVESRLNEYPIAGTGLDAKLSSLNDRTIMVIGDPENTALGRYTKQALIKIDGIKGTKLWDKINSKSVKSLSAKNNLYLIAHGETAGITYYSDAFENPEVRIISLIDEDLYDPIIYQAAVVAGENMSNARGFLAFLQSAEAKKIFKKYGFITD